MPSGMAFAGRISKFVQQQVRGFAPIGIVECWNIGKMGLGLRLGEDTAILGKWLNSS